MNNPNPDAASTGQTFVSSFSAEIETIIYRYNLKFNKVEELIEVCLVSIAVTSHLIPKHRDVHYALD